MNRATAIVTLLLCASAAPAESVPEGVTISQWVREDLFAGFLADSMDDFNRGVAKLDEILTGAPDNGVAVVWRASVDLDLAVKALESGDKEEYKRLLDKAKAGISQSYASGERHRGAMLAVFGGMAIIVGDRLGDADREDYWRQGDQVSAHRRYLVRFKGLSPARGRGTRRTSSPRRGWSRARRPSLPPLGALSR